MLCAPASTPALLLLLWLGADGLLPRLALGAAAPVLDPDDGRSGVFVAGSPPDFVARCAAGSQVLRLRPPGAVGEPPWSLVCASDSNGTACAGAGGPFLSVSGSGESGTDGVYAYEHDNGTHQYYRRGDYVLLWEPGQREVHGLRWLLYGPDGMLYYKYSPDGKVGWRSSSTAGEWSAASSVAPPSNFSEPPVIASELPEEFLEVLSAGDPGAVGIYNRVPGAGAKVFLKGVYWITWEPGPQVATGERWVLFRDPGPAGQVSQYRPYYFRLSEDGDFGYDGAWAPELGAYPPPMVGLLQTVACVPCPQGFFSNASGETECQRCPAGHVSLGAANECAACRPGRFADGPPGATRSERRDPECAAGADYLAASSGACTAPEPGAGRCSECAPGRFSAAPAAALCEPCPAGRFVFTSGAAECQDCAGGRWSPPGATECARCPAGRAHNVTQAGSRLACELCPPGAAAPSPGALGCVLCQAGRFAHTQGLTACRPCASGTASSEAGSSRCDKCPDSGIGPGAASCQPP